MKDNDYERNLRIIHRIKQINEEQKRQIAIHRWIESEKAGRDLKEEAEIDWVNRFASSFRNWAKTVPSECVKCGICKDCKNRKYCKNPFNPNRVKKLNKMRKDKLL
jgi:hypothetical protein